MEQELVELKKKEEREGKREYEWWEMEDVLEEVEGKDEGEKKKRKKRKKGEEEGHNQMLVSHEVQL